VGEDQGEPVGVSAVVRREESSPLAGMEITRMRRRHLRGVLAIEAQVYPRPWSMSLFLSELAQRTTRSYVVARHDGIVIGYCGLMVTGREGHITNIAVDPSVHGRKVGTRLLLKQVTEAIARGSDVVTLEVRVTNQIAQSMYEKFGFRIIDTRKGYYIETNEDAFVMIAEHTMSTDYRKRLEGIRTEIDSALGRRS
jgi:ribosomal-protein-alanine N-acetyltransferase